MYTTIADFTDFISDILVTEYDGDISYDITITNYSASDIISITSSDMLDDEMSQINSLSVIRSIYKKDYIEEILNYEVSLFHLENSDYDIKKIAELPLATETLLYVLIGNKQLDHSLIEKIESAFYSSGIIEEERLLDYKDYKYLTDLIIYNKQLKKVDTSNMC